MGSALRSPAGPRMLRAPMHPALPFALAAALAVLVYGLLAWERIVRRRRAEQPGTG